MKTECPDCAGEIEGIPGQEIHCGKCGAAFKPRYEVRIRKHEWDSPLQYAKAHLLAANRLLDSTV